MDRSHHLSPELLSDINFQLYSLIINYSEILTVDHYSAVIAPLKRHSLDCSNGCYAEQSFAGPALKLSHSCSR